MTSGAALQLWPGGILPHERQMRWPQHEAELHAAHAGMRQGKYGRRCAEGAAGMGGQGLDTRDAA